MGCKHGNIEGDTIEGVCVCVCVRERERERERERAREKDLGVQRMLNATAISGY